MPIKLLGPGILPSQINDILSYYNHHIQNTDPILEYFDDGKKRIFFVRFSTKNSVSFNDQVRQLHWKNGILISYYNYICLTEQEELLLYESMRTVLGETNVKYYSSVSDIYHHSPVTFSTLMQT